MKNFIIKNGQLMLERADEIILPSVDEIYSSIIEGKKVWPDVVPGASCAPADISFSRYPASLKIVIEKGAVNHSPIIRTAYFIYSKELNYRLPAVIDTEHIVCDGKWYPIDSVSISEVKDIFNDIGLAVGELNSLKSFLAIKRIASDSSCVDDRTTPESVTPLSFLPKKIDNPKDVCAELYPYQIDGWNWLRFIVSEQVGGLLADEMGLGKTLQIISVLSDHGDESVLPALVIAPGSLLENWLREINRFSPKLSVLKHHGAYRTGQPEKLREYDVVLTTYESIVRDNSLMLMVDWGAVVIDEAQNIKNPSAQRTCAIKKLHRKVALAVTGTPIENRLIDIWSILDFVIPGYLGEQSEFENKFRDDLDGGTLLEPLISPVMLRRTISSVANDLPERIDIPQAIQLEQNEAADYDAIRKSIYEQHENGASLVALSALRMFCSHPSLVENASYTHSSIDYGNINFSKFQRFDEIIEEIILRNDKAVVFSSFIKMADMISSHINKKYNIFVGCLDGRLPIGDRQILIDRFSDISGAAVLVLNPRAGGTGLNITSANHVIHYNLEWNPAVEDQASARVYRRGQIKPVTVHRLFVADTVEEVIKERLDRKRELTGSAVVGVTGRSDDYIDILAALQRSPLIGVKGGG